MSWNLSNMASDNIEIVASRLATETQQKSRFQIFA